MAKLPSLGAGATVPDILKMSPDAGTALLEMHEAIMRSPSPLTPGERELIAAYVSGLTAAASASACIRASPRVSVSKRACSRP